MRLKRLGSVAFAALLGFAVWSVGPALNGEPQAFAQSPISDVGPGAYQVSYFDVSSSFTPSQQGYGGPGHSGGAGDALLRIVDAGNFALPTFVAPDAPAPIAPAAEPGSLCANIYVFDDDQELQECCSCKLTADSVQTFSVINDLTSNPQFSSPLGLGVIKIVTSRIEGVPVEPPPLPSPVAPYGCSSGGDGAPGTAGSIGVSGVPDGFVGESFLTDGLTAWINHTESMASNNPGFTPPFGFISSTSVSHFAFASLDNTELGQLTSECLNIELHASGRGICQCGIGS